MPVDIDALPGRFRSRFPACLHNVQLNNAGLAPCSTDVVEAITHHLHELLTLRLGGASYDGIWEVMAEQTRKRAADLLGCTPGEIAFVRNTSHGLGLMAEGINWKPGDEVLLTSASEYPSNIYVWQHLHARGVRLIDIPVKSSGTITVELLRTHLSQRTRLVALSAVQYATGERADLTAIGAFCRARGILFCVDAIQILGAYPLNVQHAHIDLLAADSHKWLMGLPGMGIMYIRAELIEHMRPAVVGWKSTVNNFDFDNPDFRLRPTADRFEEGSPAYAMISGLNAALALIEEAGIDNIGRHIDACIATLALGLHERGFMLNPPEGSRASILLARPQNPAQQDPPYMQALAAKLEAAGISISLRRGWLRFAPHLFNNNADLCKALEAVSRSHTPIES